MSSVIRYTADRVETLADRLGQELSGAVTDPFAEDLILTRSGGLGRWLTQRLGLSLGSSGKEDGVCARVRICTVAQFADAVREAPSPWRSDALSEVIMARLRHLPLSPDFDHVLAHLADPATRPHRRSSFARQIGERFAAYVRRERVMLEAWWQGRDILASGVQLPPDQRWQAALWREICSDIGSTPWEDDQGLADLAIAQASSFARVAVFCPDSLDTSEERLIAALDSTRPVLGFDLVNPVTPVITGSSASLHDGSVQIHAVPTDRLAEVLSTILVDVLEEDPTIEARDILVNVHQFDAHAKSLEACLWTDDAHDAPARHQLRAALHQTTSQPVMDLLLCVFDVVDGRGPARDLARLCQFEPVMAMFGLTPTDHDRLSSLITSAGIRWGVNAAHRARQEMGDFPQNTWIAGLSRMVLGIGLDEDSGAFRGTVLPLDVIDSDSVRLVEALGQITAHVGHCCQTWIEPATGQAWAGRCLTLLEALVGPQVAADQAGAILGQLRAQKAEELSLREAKTRLEALGDRNRHRSGFLNGDLTICPFGAMSLVPYQVVIDVAMSADTFPRSPLVDGDDVAGVWHTTCESAREIDRRGCQEALISARKRYIAIYCGFDGATGSPKPMPAPLATITAASMSAEPCPDSPTGEASLLTTDEDSDRFPHASCQVNSAPEGLVVIHPPESFATRPQPVIAPRNHGRSQTGGRSFVTESAHNPPAILITDLVDLFTNPAAHWLKRRSGLTAAALSDPELMPVEIPLTITALQKWQITDRMLRGLRQGKTPDQLVQAELRQGGLPPGQMGTSLAMELMGSARDIVKRGAPHLQEPVSWRWVDCDEGQLSGPVAVHGGQIVDVMASRVQPRHQVAAWIKLLGLMVTFPDVAWQAVMIGSRSQVTLSAPELREAENHLRGLLMVYRLSLTCPVGLPPSASAYLAHTIAKGLPPVSDEVRQRLETEWSRDPMWAVLWPTPDDLLAEHDETDDAPEVNNLSHFEALVRQIWVPIIKAGGKP